MNNLKRMNEGLPALIVTILIYGVFLIAIGVWFPEDRVRYVTGVITGIGCAIYMAISIASVIQDAIDGDEEATTKLQKKSVFRYGVVVVIFFAMMYFRWGQLVPGFLGVFGLKICSYVQPYIHYSILHDWDPDEEESDTVDNVEEEEN